MHADAPVPGLDPVHAPYLRDRPVLSYVEPDDPWPRRVGLAALERACGRSALERIYRELRGREDDPDRFFENALAAAGIEVRLDGTPPAALPGEGPLVLVANHPFGILDGLVLCRLALALRGDFRILLHARLCQDRSLAPRFLPVDFTETPRARATNLRSRQLALEALERGVPLLVFPGGGISTRSRLGFGPLADLPWSTTTAKLVARSRATVVPCFFHGENGRFFHLASHFSQSLRLALLLRETRRRFARPCRVTVGRPLPWEELEKLGNRRALTTQLYAATWALARSG